MNTNSLILWSENEEIEKETWKVNHEMSVVILVWGRKKVWQTFF